jgi:biotin carboxylase
VNISGEEMVVIVRDMAVVWVVQLAEAIRAAGCLVGLVTVPLEEKAAARLASKVDATATVDDLTDPRQVADAALRLATGRRLGAVLSASDGAVLAAAEAAELIGIGHTPARGIALSRNKYAAREMLRSAGLAVPEYALLGNAADAAAVADQVGLPAVIKPISGTGSHLVQPVDSVAELAQAYQTLAARVPAANLGLIYSRLLDCGDADQVDPTRTFLVESKLRGREFCLDLIVRDGETEQLGLFDKFIVDEKFFEPGIVTPPFDLEPEREHRIRAAVDDAVSALGLDNTVAHVEIIDDDASGPTIVEVNAGRPAGGLVGAICELTAGINLSAELVAATRGVPSPRTPPKLPMAMASLAVFAQGSGRLRAIHGLDEVEALADVVHVEPGVQPGDVITDEYEVFAVNVIVAGFLNREDLLETYDHVAKAVRIELDPHQ